MTLMLHCGAEKIDYDVLRQLETPDATRTHVPIPHFRLVDIMRHTLSFYGHSITEEHHATTKGGDRYFGLMMLESDYTGYTDTVIVRNSHDRSFPAAVGLGSSCFCCDNLAFIADRSVARRHTKKLKRDLPGLIGEMIEPLAVQREAQHNKIMLYQDTELTGELADHTILNLYREGVLNVQRIPEVLAQWDEPDHEEWMPGTAWHLFNATTFALAGRVAEDPGATCKLHAVIDGVCERVAA